jgi:pilus assembly protein CpaB
MKNTRAVVMVAISVVLGLVVSALAVNWVSHKGAVASNKVVVAAMDIQLGSRLTPQMVTMVDWPSGSVPAGAFEDPKVVNDRVVKASIQRGEAILNARLAPVGTQGGLSAVITEGKRAMTVRVNDVVGVAGFALPGNYVDVMVNAQQDRASAGEETHHISKTVLRHVLVLAVAQEAGRDDTKPKVVNAVTLELSLEDAEKLDLARNIGTLSLVLRNQIDTADKPTSGVRKADLFGPADVPRLTPASIQPSIKRLPPVVVRSPARAAVVTQPKIEVIRGMQRSNVDLVSDTKMESEAFPFRQPTVN